MRSTAVVLDRHLKSLADEVADLVVSFETSGIGVR